jgi:hypothetical protein
MILKTAANDYAQADFGSCVHFPQLLFPLYGELLVNGNPAWRHKSDEPALSGSVGAMGARG